MRLLPIVSVSWTGMAWRSLDIITKHLDPNNILQVFLQCKEAFPNMSDLLRNMMGLLGNIAEVSTSFSLA